MSSKPQGGAQQRPHQLSGPARVAVLVAGLVVLVAAVVYCAGCVYFYQRFWPNTTIADTNVSLMGAEEATLVLENATKNRTITVSGQGASFTLTGATSGLELDAEAAVAAALADNQSWLWPTQLFSAHDESDEVTESFDRDLLRSSIEDALSSFNATASEPTDAFLYYDTATCTYQINPGSLGTKLDVDSVTETVVGTLTSGRRTRASLTSANLVQQNVSASDETLVATRDAANVYLSCNIELTVGGSVAATLGPDTVAGWLTINDDGSVTLDDAALTTWASTLESLIDSRGKTRTYTQPTTGKTVTVTGTSGTYGWVSNGSELLQLVRDAVYNGYTGTYEVPLKQSAAVFNPGGADWGLRYVDVDLTAQWIYFYDEWGNLVYNTCIISGMQNDEDPTEHATPTGVYVLNNKARDQTLIGLTDEETGEPEYETDVSYWMPFIGNAIGLHDADWQNWSGWYATYYQLYGSHGCVNMPPAAAAWAYEWLQIGDVIITHY